MKRTLSAAIVVAVVLAVALGAYAQAGISSLPGGGWWEASQIMNVGGGTAQVQFTPILGLGVSGATANPASTTIDMNKSKTFGPGFGDAPLTMDDGFKGSAVVSSDEPIVAIGSVQNNFINLGGGDSVGVSGGRAAAQYPGISQEDVGTTLVFPVVKSDYRGKTTTFYIQTVEAGTVNATYAMNQGADTYTDSATTTVDGQMATFSPQDASGMPSGCSDNTCLGAVTFTSSVEMAGVYVEANTTEDPGQILLSTRGFTPSDFDDTVVIPAVKSVWRGRTTGVQVANASTSASTITMTLAYQDGSASAADGETVVFSNVLPGTSVTFFPGNHGVFDGPFGTPTPTDEFLGSAQITSDQPMVAICNENDFASASTTKQTVYAGFPKSAASDTVLFPLAKEFYGDNQTGLQIMNVGEDPITLEADYAFDTGTFTVDEDASGATITLNPNEPFTFWGVTDFWSGSYDTYKGGFGAVTVRASGGDNLIVGVAQEAEFPGGAKGYLDTKNYEGFNQ